MTKNQANKTIDLIMDQAEIIKLQEEQIKRLQEKLKLKV